MSDVIFTLNHHLMYQEKDNPTATLKELKLIAPTKDHLLLLLPVKQGLIREIMKEGRESAKNDFSKIKEEGAVSGIKKIDMPPIAIIFMLYGGELDLANYIDNFKRLCCGGVVKTQDGETITRTIIDRLDPSDLDRLMGEYLSNFIIASLM